MAQLPPWLGRPIPAEVRQFATHAESSIQGFVQGDYNTVTINFTDEGARVNPAQASPGPSRRPSPVRLLAPPIVGFLDREDERALTLQALDADSCVELLGVAGTGKTALLRALSHDDALLRLEGGTVFVGYRGEPIEDVIQDLFDCFFEWPGTAKVSEGRARWMLADVRAALLLDDFDVEQPDYERLRNTLPRSLLVSSSRTPFGEGVVVRVQGLSISDGVRLFRARLGRKLLDNEKAAAQFICEAVCGNPLKIVQAVGRILTTGTPIADLAAEIAPADYGSVTTLCAVVVTLPTDHQEVLWLLTALGDVAIDADIAQELTGKEATSQILRSLEKLGLAVALRDQVERGGRGTPDSERERLASSGTATAGTRFRVASDEVRKAVHSLFGAPPHATLVDWAVKRDATSRCVHDLQLVALLAACQLQRWDGAISLGRLLDAPLALDGRWSTWRSALAHVAEAARHTGDGPALGWALNELGARALCLEQYDEARHSLEEARLILQRSDNSEAVATAEWNLLMLPLLGSRVFGTAFAPSPLDGSTQKGMLPPQH